MMVNDARRIAQWLTGREREELLRSGDHALSLKNQLMDLIHQGQVKLYSYTKLLNAFFII